MEARMSLKKLFTSCIFFIFICNYFLSVSILKAEVDLTPQQYLAQSKLWNYDLNNNWANWLSSTGEMPPDFDTMPYIPMPPDPLMLNEGTANATPVTTTAQWNEKRAWIKTEVQKWITGTVPPFPTNISYSSGRLTFSGTNGSVSIPISISGSGNVPVVILANNWGDNPAGAATSRGWIACTYNATPSDSGGTNSISQNIKSAYPGYTFSDLTRLAWAAGVIAKWFATTSTYNIKKDSNGKPMIGVTGHSRCGKIALLAGAFSDDITASAPNCGGTGGENLWRYTTSRFTTEPIGGITGGEYHDWFYKRIRFFIGRETKLPVDMNSIQALCAPRGLILTNAANDIGGNAWGVEASYHSVQKLYKFLGVENKVGVFLRWGDHGYPTESINQNYNFFAYVWGLSSNRPADLPRTNYTFEKWKTLSNETVNPTTYPVKSLADLLKNENDTTITTTSEWDMKKAQIKSKLQWALGTRPSNYSFSPSNSNYGAASNKPGGATQITINNSSGQKLYTGYLYPASSSPYPVIIYLNPSSYSHGLSAELHPRMISSLTGKGVGFFSLDVLGTGQRIEEGTNFFTRAPNWTKMGKMIEDIKYAVDVLSARSDVDKQRIYVGGYGNYGGALAICAAVLDERISGVVSLAGFTPMRTAGIKYQGAAMYSVLDGLLPRLGFFLGGNENRLPFDFDELVGAIAPRPVEVMPIKWDGEADLDGVTNMVVEDKKVFDLYNKGSNLTQTTPHYFNDMEWYGSAGVCLTAFGNRIAAIKGYWDGVELKGSASATSIAPNGNSTSVITAEIRDRMGRRTSYSGSASFSITSGNGSGTLSSTSATFSSGLATVTLNSTTTPGDVIVKITAGSLNEYTIKISVSNPDTTAPGKITTLATGAVTYNSVVLNWNAVADDGTTGAAASSYIIGYANSQITDATWGNATKVTQNIIPKTPGQPETYTVNGLNGSTLYYFAVKAVDDGGLQSVVSNSPNETTLNPPADIIAPAQITLSAGSATQTAITLSWTAVGDDGTISTATSYDIRYSLAQITDANWGSATPVTGEPTPKAAGGSETKVINGLTENTQYYFAIKAGDEIPNMGPLSNIASARTLSQAGTVAEWHFDEGTGSSASDSSGNSNTGTLTGSPAWVAGKVGAGALQFDGLNTYVSVNDSNSLDLTNGISIETWVKCADISQDGSTRRVLDKGSYLIGASDKAYFKILKGGIASSVEKTWTSADVNVWHHIVGTYDGATMKLYQDGVKAAEIATTGNIDTNTTALNIGRQPSGAGRFSGIIDEVKIYNRALTDAEVLSHYNPAPVDNPPTVSITAPSPNATISGSVTITATATDDNGVSKVNFYVDDVIKSTDTTSPYTYALDTTGYANGVHTIKAVATDTANQTANSQISVTVNNVAVDNPPTVAITAPANNATVSASVTITATATDDNGVASISFYVDDILKNTDTTSPYTYSLDTTGYANGVHTIKAVATDTIAQTANAQIS